MQKEAEKIYDLANRRDLKPEQYLKKISEEFDIPIDHYLEMKLLKYRTNLIGLEKITKEILSVKNSYNSLSWNPLNSVHEIEEILDFNENKHIFLFGIFYDNVSQIIMDSVSTMEINNKKCYFAKVNNFYYFTQHEILNFNSHNMFYTTETILPNEMNEKTEYLYYSNSSFRFYIASFFSSNKGNYYCAKDFTNNQSYTIVRPEENIIIPLDGINIYET